MDEEALTIIILTNIIDTKISHNSTEGNFVTQLNGLKEIIDSVCT